MCVYVCLCVWEYVCKCSYVYVRICLYVGMRMYICHRDHTLTQTHALYKHTYTHIYTYIHSAYVRHIVRMYKFFVCVFVSLNIINKN